MSSFPRLHLAGTHYSTLSSCTLFLPNFYTQTYAFFDFASTLITLDSTSLPPLMQLVNPNGGNGYMIIFKSSPNIFLLFITILFFPYHPHLLLKYCFVILSIVFYFLDEISSRINVEILPTFQILCNLIENLHLDST